MSWNTEFSNPYQIRIIARKQTGSSLQQLGRHPPHRRVILGLIRATVLGSPWYSGNGYIFFPFSLKNLDIKQWLLDRDT